MFTRTLATKIYVLLGLSMLAGGGATLVLFLRVATVSATYDRLVHHEVHQQDIARQMQVHFKRQVQEWKNILLRGADPTALAQYTEGFHAEERQVREVAETLRQTVTDAEFQKLLTQFVLAHTHMSAAYAQALAAFTETGGQQPGASDAMVKGIDRAPTDLIDQMVERLQTRVAEQHAVLQANIAATQRKVALGTLGVFGLLVAGMIAFTRHIISALRQMVGTAHHIAAGDLTTTIAVTSRDEIGQLTQAMHTMSEKLRQIVSEIRHAATTVSTVASEIVEGNADLSQRTQEQAAALEETAASMEEMTSTVQQNADNARQANQLAASTCRQAEQGSGVVGQAVAAMAAISHSSKKIAEITGVIDGIAFQTNLLALNAAVEAARAGEQGRGFAVVAAEVRKLAQRSAEAAKEIKALIMDSGEKVEGGTHLVNESGKTLAEIVTAVKKVSDLMAEIAAATQEQAAGIEQVNKAVMQMDEMTQQNAALVEEAAAASTSAEVQAHTLRQLMEFFTLETSVEAHEPGGIAVAGHLQETRRVHAAGVGQALIPHGQASTVAPAPGRRMAMPHAVMRPPEPRRTREDGNRRVSATTNSTDGEWTEF